MRSAKTILIAFVFLVTGVFANAQTDTTKEQTRASFKLGVYYNSGLNYYGRTDSLQSSGFFPLAELWFNKNVYVNAAPVFIMNNLAPFEYAGTVSTLGSRFGKENKWSANIYLVKPFYRDNSQLVQSALKAQLAGTYTWLNKSINVTLGGDIKLSDRLDYGATAGLDHIFRFELSGRSVLVLDPSVYVNAGTQQFTRTSYKKSGFLLFPGSLAEVTEQVSKFNMLSYEFSMPVVLGMGKLQLIANPAYVIPQNLVKVEGRPDLSERGREMFYFTTGIKVSF
jgi:hypothetical protein